LHAGVAQVIPVAIRRWRRSPLSGQTRGECCNFLQRIRHQAYDAIIDTQGLLKSALVTCVARGVKHGLDWKSSREPLRLFYDRTYAVPWGQHAVTRNRSLAAQALGYAVISPADYGIGCPTKGFPWLPGGRYAVLLHATSADAKLWSESLWAELSKYLFLNNIVCVLPWGNAVERDRSERLAAAMQQAIVPPALALHDAARLIAGAHTVVGVDTGLTHLAAALGVPTVGVYGATDPAATGIHAGPHAVNLGGIGAPPSVQDVIAALERLMPV
jgi:heptosyltransferase-1